MTTCKPKAFINEKGHHGDSAKKRPCLVCDKQFYTTEEIRICADCKGPKGNYAEASGSMEYGRGDGTR